MGVKATHKEYDRRAPQWKRCRDVVAGQDAMHAAGTAYLPKLKEEQQADYDARLKRSDFFNGTWRTIDALSGMVFRKSPTSDIPAGIESYLDDVTLTGMSMEDFAEEIVTERLSVGPVGILVDHPPQVLDDEGKVVPITVKVAETLGMRPTLKLYLAETVRNWKRSQINNAWVYTQVVLGEQHEEPKDEFESACVTRYRVLDLDGAGQYRQRVFEVKDEKDILVEGPLYPLMNGQPLDYIPFALAGDFDDPPLIDLVDKNIAHYQVNSDYRHGLHFCGLPTAFFAGVTPPDNADGTPGKIYIGGSAAISTPEPQAKAEYLEFTGQGLVPMEKALDRIEKQMALLGARMIADESSQAETLGATQIKRAGENSVLGKIVKSTSRTLEWALTIFAKWAGHEATIVYQLNRDFLPQMMDAQTLSALFAGVMSGNISKRELFELLQRGDVIDGEKQYEEHQREIDEEAPTLARPDVKPKPDEDEEEAA
jgi:hypothetical protein